jgi:uncharacterized protein with HEPN domain
MTDISPDAAKYLWDARHAAERIARFTAGRGFGDYMSDDMLRAAVERQFEIAGEAFNGLRRAAPDLAQTIPDLPRIIAFRNVLIHGYATVDDQLVWGVVERDLPILLAMLTQMLAAAER